jgi:deoxyribose-phosphate aldolase
MTLEFAARVESLLAKPYPITKEIEAFCNDARLSGYRGVVVPSSAVDLAYDRLGEEGLKVTCLVGYPFGQSAPDTKRYETELAVDAGAYEIELVPSISAMIEGKHAEVLREIRDVVEAADERPVKVAIELSLWSTEELSEIAKMLLDSGAQFLSTSVAPPLRRPITEDDVKRLREQLGETFGLKVGGLRTADGAEGYLAAGAQLIGLLV